EIYYNDGTKLMFESPGDMLTFYSSPNKFRVSPVQQDGANITKISVRDYQTREAIDARQATLVVNSKIEEPMGPDFLPFGKSADAIAFISANGGRTVSLTEVTPEMVHNVRGSL